MNEVFKLISTYEIFIKLENAQRALRVEIFESLNREKTFRTRIWQSRTYNSYPTFANIFENDGLQNENLSCDELAQDVSHLVLEDPELLLGKEFESEKAFLKFLMPFLEKYESLQG